MLNSVHSGHCVGLEEPGILEQLKLSLKIHLFDPAQHVVARVEMLCAHALA